MDSVVGFGVGSGFGSGVDLGLGLISLKPMASEGDKYWNADEGNLVQRLYLARASGVIISGRFLWALEDQLRFCDTRSAPFRVSIIALRSDHSAL